MERLLVTKSKLVFLLPIVFLANYARAEDPKHDHEDAMHQAVRGYALNTYQAPASKDALHAPKAAKTPDAAQAPASTQKTGASDASQVVAANTNTSPLSVKAQKENAPNIVPPVKPPTPASSDKKPAPTTTKVASNPKTPPRVPVFNKPNAGSTASGKK